MKFATFDNRPGVVVGEHLYDLTPHGFSSLGEVIARGNLAALEAIVGKFATPEAKREGVEKGLLSPLSAVTLMAPVAPERFYCVGMNYKAHLAQWGSTSLPERPVGLLRNPGCIIAAGEPIRLPSKAPNAVEPEGELGIVIGSKCFEVSEAEANDHIFGYTIVNDVSARDWAGGARTAETMFDFIAAMDANILAKQFPTFAPLGPWIVSKDEIADPADLEVITFINGEARLQGSTSDFIFPLASMIAYLSQFICFMPGDVISTGGPGPAPGVGHERRFLRRGDRVTVWVSGIGELSNPVA